MDAPESSREHRQKRQAGTERNSHSCYYRPLCLKPYQNVSSFFAVTCFSSSLRFRKYVGFAWLLLKSFSAWSSKWPESGMIALAQRNHHVRLRRLRQDHDLRGGLPGMPHHLLAHFGEARWRAAWPSRLRPACRRSPARCARRPSCPRGTACRTPRRARTRHSSRCSALASASRTAVVGQRFAADPPRGRPVPSAVLKR